MTKDGQGVLQAIKWRAILSGTRKLHLVSVEYQYKKVVKGFHCRTGLIDRSVLLRLGQQDRNACASTYRDI